MDNGHGGKSHARRCNWLTRTTSNLLLFLVSVVSFSPTSRFYDHTSTNTVRSYDVLLQAASDSVKESNKEQEEVPIRFFLDMAVQEKPIGRLVCVLPQPRSLFPIHTRNLVQLLSQARRSVDPLCHYCNCEFMYSPQYIEGLAQYKWAHVLSGRGRNAEGRPTERISDTTSCQTYTHRLYGGIYYGLDYEELTQVTLPNMYPSFNDDSVVASSTPVLTIPMAGPNRGSTQFSLVRVNESPPEWRERLLLNSAVIGWLEPAGDSRAVLKAMAQQRQGPPVVVDTGILGEDDR